MTEKIAVLLRWGRARAMSSEFDTTSTWLIMRVFRAYTFVSFAVALSSSLGQVLNTLVAGNVLGQVSVAAIGISAPVSTLFTSIGCVVGLGGWWGERGRIGLGWGRGCSRPDAIGRLVGLR